MHVRDFKIARRKATAAAAAVAAAPAAPATAAAAAAAMPAISRRPNLLDRIRGTGFCHRLIDPLPVLPVYFSRHHANEKREYYILPGTHFGAGVI